MGDIGINATSAIIENLKKQVAEKHIKNPAECKQLLIEEIKEQMRVDSTEYAFENQKSVILVIGVNGVGKTTSVGKLAGKLKDQGKKSYPCSSGYLPCSSQVSSLHSGQTVPVWILSEDRQGLTRASIVYDAVAAAKARNAVSCSMVRRTDSQ